MILKKKAKTFNDYTLEISFGQLEVIAASLEQDHSDPVADELHAELQWYMQRVPGPGEEEEDLKAREDSAPGAPTGNVEDEGVPVPMPPTEGSADQGEAPPTPDEFDEEGGPGAPGGENENAEPGEVSPEAIKTTLSGGGPVPEPGYTDDGSRPEADEELPPPPNE
jgi:hypothetical protein